MSTAPKRTTYNQCNRQHTEMRAVYNAMNADVFKRYAEVHIHVDNTSVEAALKRGTSRTSADLARELLPICEALIRDKTRLSVSYIASLKNPADATSRGNILYSY